MRNIRIVFASLLLLALLAPISVARADGGVIMAPSTVDVDPYIALLTQEYLQANPPVATSIYAISNVNLGEGGTYVSVVGIDPNTPAPYNWSLEDGNAIWTGSLLYSDGVMKLFNPNAGQSSILDKPLMMDLVYPFLLFGISPRPAGGAGGGPDIYFPWQTGRTMMFGPRGIHGAGDYGTSGMYAIDWVSGTDLGSTAAGPQIFASASGTVDYVCNDGTSVAIRVSGGGNTILYAHLINNSTLASGHAFSRSGYIGTLKFGSFNDSCGWAQQSANHYHVHWMITPSGGKFNAEGWTLNFGTSKWTRGNSTVAINQWMTGGGGSGSYSSGSTDDPSVPVQTIVIDTTNPGNTQLSGLHFWDFLIQGISSLFQSMILNNLPPAYSSQESDDLWTMMTNMTATMISDANVMLVNDVINIMPWIYLGIFVMTFNAIFFAFGAVVLVFRIIKLLPFL